LYEASDYRRKGWRYSKRGETMLQRVALMIGLSACLASGVCAQTKVPSLSETYHGRLEKILMDNIASFWYPRCLDRRYGGYTISYDAEGKLTPGGSKMIVTQARTVWFFARMARAGYRRDEYLKAADHGYRFLREKMWDAKNGGFYWEVDETGSRKLRAYKHLYGQSFALYGLSEFALASERKDVLEFANAVFDLLEQKAHDSKYGGYHEFFTEDWKPAPASASTYMFSSNAVKLMNTHLHLMEAMTAYYRASRLPLARERLLELIAIESSAVVRKDLPACTDKFQPDWTPILNPPLNRVSYGHDIENVWLLMDACVAAGVPIGPYQDLCRALFGYSRHYGFDDAEGGFYESGPFNQPADRRDKVWWTQAEGLVSCLYMYRLTGDTTYLDLFAKTLSFVEKRQIDWRNGEWHETISPDGAVKGTKGHIWKAAYHNARSMIECLEVIASLEEGEKAAAKR
jgi:mannose/cellobiose epimerase-like protein (N-acyl-D-glucosamine 2-epimerase family)